LTATKNLTGLGRIVENQHREGFAVARATGLRLSWTPSWVDTVLHQCLAVILAWRGGPLADLTAEALDRFESELVESMRLSRSSMKAYRVSARQPAPSVVRDRRARGPAGAQALESQS